MTHVPPTYNVEAFSCPHCATYAHMQWTNVSSSIHGGLRFRVARCQRCRRDSMWRMDGADEGHMIHPAIAMGPSASIDMPESCREDYDEAREIAGRSPRGAAALLRLCIQKLCKELGQPGKNINHDIGALVKQGLPATVQQALDVVRVVGNNAVHPGTMSQDDHSQHVASLFRLVNMIVQQMITQPKEIKAMYEALPAGLLEAIDKRDGT